MLEKKLESDTVKFVQTIKETDIYWKYHVQLARIKTDPELFQRVNEYRWKNYELHNTSQVDQLFDRIEAFEKEYAAFRENPMVDDFLNAELAFCRMMQEINVFITKELEFE